ncbi:ROK family protein [Nonomuraea sp. NBC_01738]|uniref:ROK family protein n=1 Tax=Nonomuraea sp. NBC_01738 TaxID=2976003 RepID=UPI002E115C18|nr:ROK family protein [Nonomuraea sp. NBC_01738]
MGSARRSTVSDLRRGNRALVLRALYFGGPASRQELALSTGLSAATLTNVTADLLFDGVIGEAGHVGSDGGRPRVLLRVNAGHGYALGAEVGETHVRVDLFDLAMSEHGSAEYPLPPGEHDPALVADLIAAGADRVLLGLGLPRARILGLGAGVPGIVERSGVVHAQAYGWRGAGLGGLLRERLPYPVFVENGAKAMGQAELWSGAGQGVTDAVVVLVGSGVGAAIVTGRRAYRGVGGSAGEWGHTPVAVGGRLCRCGSRGCLEAYVGAESVIARHGSTGDGDTRAAFTRVLDDPSPEARRVVAETVTYLGAGLGGLVNLLNPERIILGGWAGLLLGAGRLPAIREAARAYALTQPYEKVTIELGRLGPDAVTAGAATLVVADFLSG